MGRSRFLVRGPRILEIASETAVLAEGRGGQSTTRQQVLVAFNFRTLTPDLIFVVGPCELLCEIEQINRSSVGRSVD